MSLCKRKSKFLKVWQLFQCFLQMMWGGKVTHFKSLIKNPGHGLEGGLISQLKIHECFQMLLIKELSRLGLGGGWWRERGRQRQRKWWAKQRGVVNMQRKTGKQSKESSGQKLFVRKPDDRPVVKTENLQCNFHTAAEYGCHFPLNMVVHSIHSFFFLLFSTSITKVTFQDSRLNFESDFC